MKEKKMKKKESIAGRGERRGGKKGEEKRCFNCISM